MKPEKVEVPSGREWLKAKHASYKPRGRYMSGHNDNNPKVKKVGNKQGLVPDPTHERVLVIDAITGKRRWGWRLLPEDD